MVIVLLKLVVASPDLLSAPPPSRPEPPPPPSSSRRCARIDTSRSARNPPSPELPWEAREAFLPGFWRCSEPSEVELPPLPPPYPFPSSNQREPSRKQKSKQKGGLPFLLAGFTVSSVVSLSCFIAPQAEPLLLSLRSSFLSLPLCVLSSKPTFLSLPYQAENGFYSFSLFF